MDDDKIYFYKDTYHKGKFFSKKRTKEHEKPQSETEAIETKIHDSQKENVDSLLEISEGDDEPGSKITKLLQLNNAEKENKIGKPKQESVWKSPLSFSTKYTVLNVENDTNTNNVVKESSRNTEEADRVAKRVIKDLFVYILFVIAASVVEFSMSSRSAVFFSDTLNMAFMETPFFHSDMNSGNGFRSSVFPPSKDTTPSNMAHFFYMRNSYRDRPEGGVAGGTQQGNTAKTLKKSTTISDFWNFAETTFVNMMYWEFWFSFKNESTHTERDDQQNFYLTEMLGVPRLRQLRVRGDSCEIHEGAKHLFSACYGYYSEDNQDKSSILPYNNGTINYTTTGWKYTEENELSTVPYNGIFSTYGGGGYHVDMSVNRTLTKLRIQELKNNLWINRGTRAIIIDFTVYNTNVNLFVVSKIIVEIPATGGIYASGEFHTLKLLRYVSDEDFVVMGFELTVIFFMAYYTYMTLSAIIKTFHHYFFNAWNILDIIIIFFGNASIVCGIYRYLVIEEVVIESMQVVEGHESFDIPKYIQTVFNHISTVLIFFIWIKLFKYLQFNQTINEINKTMARSTKGIFYFTMIFSIVVFIFAQFGYLIFGTKVLDYRTVWTAAMSLLQTVLGRIDYQALEDTNIVLGPIYFILFVYSLFFILMNMFGAIIIESYDTVKSQISPASEGLVGSYISKMFTNIFTCCKSKKKPSGEKDFVVSKIQQSLSREGFSAEEIDVFFAKNEVRVDPDITRHEAKKLIAKLELRRFDFDPIELDERTVADLVQEFEKMKTYIEQIGSNIDIQSQRMNAFIDEHHRHWATQTPAWPAIL